MSATEQLQFPSGRAIGNCRKDAKRLCKEQHISLNDALDRVARINGLDLPWAKAIQHLKSHAPDVRAAARTSARRMTVQDIQAVIERAPHLTHYGWGPFYRGRESGESYGDGLRRGQAELLAAVDECNRALEFLAHVQPRKTLNRSAGTSYGLKHDVERFHAAFPGVERADCYVSNGSFICAALHLGFKARRVSPASPNLIFNFSSRSPVFEWEKLKAQDVDRYPGPHHEDPRYARLKELEALFRMTDPD